jgi:hypothetical protein
MALHSNTMGNAPTSWFGWNQRWERAIGWVLPSKLKQFFYTQQSTAAMADGIACGNATPKPNKDASSQHYG